VAERFDHNHLVTLEELVQYSADLSRLHLVSQFV